MKNTILIDLDTDRTEPGHIILQKFHDKPLEGWEGEEKTADFATLLEAISVVVDAMDKEKIQSRAESIKKALKHLESALLLDNSFKSKAGKK